MISTALASPLRRRVVVVAASTLAVGTISAIAPTAAIVTASAATTSAVTTAGLVAGTGSVSSIGTSVTAPTARTAPSTTVTLAARAGMVAPFRFGTVGYNQWWAKHLMAARYRWTSTGQFRCLVTLWNFESHWNHRAHNRRSGAHGIPQALPGSKMRSAGPDWRTNPVTQIAWGLRYIQKRYSTPCGALRSFYRHGWY